MEPSSQSASSTLPGPGAAFRHALRREDLAYQAVTVGAILVVLASMWLF